MNVNITTNFRKHSDYEGFIKCSLEPSRQIHQRHHLTIFQKPSHLTDLRRKQSYKMYLTQFTPISTPIKTDVLDSRIRISRYIENRKRISSP